MDDGTVETPPAHAGKVLKTVPQQEKAMETMQSTAPSTGSGTAGHRNAAVREAAVFKPRYGRCALALAGLLLLLTAAVTGVLRLFALSPAWLPVTALFLAAGVVVLLRRLAVRDRRAKMEAAFRSAMAPARTEQAAAVPAEPRETAIFDAEAHGREAARLTAVELREAALKVAEAAGDVAAPGTSGAEWQPVDVPKPVYVDAAKATRPAPEPLDLPAQPKPVGKPILKNAAAAPALPAAQTPFGRTQAAAKASAAKQNALGNLDDVLQRRRA